MKPIGTTAVAILMLRTLLPAAAGAQDWNSERARGLAEHAMVVRAAQLADSGLRTYKASAHGYLTFLAQFGEGFRDPPKVVRTDEIESDIYWAAPSLSKQYVKGRRDTLLLPTDIAYHRDHLGIVQNNFPSTIRIGDGDEVKDVPHPLSASGLAQYDFAIADSLQIQLGQRTLDVIQLRFRPRDAHAERAVGSVYVDRESGAVVRMALGFTRAALRDKDLEDLTVILESGLIDGRYWLPRRQEVEIRRTGTWLDYPARGIIRGRWDISDYEVNASVAGVFDGGPEIEAAPGAFVSKGGLVSTPGFKFGGGILDSLPPDVAAFASNDVAKLRDEAQALVGQTALARASSAALAGHAVSDFVHVNRVEGIAIGGGASLRTAPGFALTAGGSYGFSDEQFKPYARASVDIPGGETLTLSGYRMLADASVVPERSRLVNSFAAQEFGDDYTDLYQATGGSVTFAASRASWHPSLELAIEDQRGLLVHARPASGSYQPALPVVPLRESRVALSASMPHFDLGSMHLSADGNVAAVHDDPDGAATGITYARGSVNALGTVRAEQSELRMSFIGAGLSVSDAPQQALIRMGGPVTAPGYDFHQFAGRGALAARLELRSPIPFIPIPLGSWGTAPAKLTLAPYVNGAWIDGAGWRPSAGVGALTVFDLLRFDVARGLRGGRWIFSFDVSREFWNIL